MTKANTKKVVSKEQSKKEIYDFYKMGRKVAEDSFERCIKISERLDEDFGETAKLKFEYGFYKKVTEHASDIFEGNMKKTSTVEKK